LKNNQVEGVKEHVTLRPRGALNNIVYGKRTAILGWLEFWGIIDIRYQVLLISKDHNSKGTAQLVAVLLAGTIFASTFLTRQIGQFQDPAHKEGPKGSRKNNLADFALRFRLGLVDPIEQSHRNGKLFRGFCE
jgi:hypothetical protein